MRTVTQKTFETKCRNGEWQCDAEPNSFGTAWVRKSGGKQFAVRVTN